MGKLNPIVSNMLSQVTVATYHLAFVDSLRVTSLTSLDCACKTQHWDSSTEPLDVCVCVRVCVRACVCVCVCESLSSVWDFVSPWTIAHQTPLSCNSPGKNTGEGRCSLLHHYIVPLHLVWPRMPVWPGLEASQKRRPAPRLTWKAPMTPPWGI